MIWVGTSWKMTGTRASAREYCDTLARADPDGWRGIQPFVVPPFTLIAQVHDALGAGSPFLVGAQDAHWAPPGAWTGEVSVPQVADAGAVLVELGHSERRAHLGETDERVNLKVEAVLAAGLRPLVCVGDSAQELASGRSADVVSAQIDAALAGVATPERVLVAYEPVWAIGECGRPPAPGEIEQVVDRLARRFGDSVQAILYGGSVGPDNAADLLRVPGVGGLFVGRAAWRAEGYLDLLRRCGTVVAENQG
ncbi:MAG TPA: triose-phosphate isomerase [Cellulomonas sp.]